MKYLKRFNESLERGQIIFSGETKNGWKYSVAYDKMMSLVDHGSSLDGLVTMEDI